MNSYGESWVDKHKDWSAYDQLPPLLRLVVSHHTHEVNCTQVLTFYQKAGLQKTITSLLHQTNGGNIHHLPATIKQQVLTCLRRE